MNASIEQSQHVRRSCDDARIARVRGIRGSRVCGTRPCEGEFGRRAGQSGRTARLRGLLCLAVLVLERVGRGPRAAFVAEIGTMKVAVIHSFYRAGLPSGENAAVVQQVETLRESGCEVLLIAKSSDEEVLRRLSALRMAWIVGTGRGGSPLPVLRDFGAQIVHAHNLFPNFGTAWLRRWSGPLVVSVHNYRMICANGLFLRSGHLCTECLDGRTLRAIRHGCYRGSRIASAPIALANRGGWVPVRFSRGPTPWSCPRRGRRVLVPSGSAEVLLPRYPQSGQGPANAAATAIGLGQHRSTVRREGTCGTAWAVAGGGAVEDHR